MLRIGAWCVNPTSGQISRDGETARVEVRTMRLLLCLAEHAGEVVSIDDLLNQVWSGVIVAPPSTRRRLQAAHLHRDSAATIDLCINNAMA
jgi:DNA-binding winged helix-turn-helix (wHTH) protein